MTEEETKQHNDALKLLNIDPLEWAQKTPAVRKSDYKHIIREAKKKFSVDHTNSLPDTDPFKKTCEQNTRLLNSLNYEDTAVFESKPSTFKVNQDDEWTIASNGEEFRWKMSALLQEDKKNRYDAQFSFGKAVYRNKPLEYFNFMKEQLPNILTLDEHDTAFRHSNRLLPFPDIYWIQNQLCTKAFLRRYIGSSEFVSALVSRDQLRIKKTFDAMVVALKNTYLLDFFAYYPLQNFIDLFCNYNPAPNKRGTIDPETVSVLCESLSLDLEGHQMTMELDPSIMKKALNKYIFNEKRHSLIQNQAEKHESHTHLQLSDSFPSFQK